MMRKSESASSATGTCPVIMEELDKINGGIYELQTELGAPSEASKEDLDFLSRPGRKINNQQPN